MAAAIEFDKGYGPMKSYILSLRSGRSLLAAGALAAVTAVPASAQEVTMEAVTAAIDASKGETAYIFNTLSFLMTGFLVMFMAAGFAMLEAGLVRTKNMLSVLTQVMAIVAMVGLLWCFYGYSISLGDSGGYYLGGFGKAFLKGIDANSVSATFSNGVVIPEYAYMVFQMTFAMITPALIVGAFAERMKFSAVMLFSFLWVTFVYFPVAHWVWATPAPDDLAAAAKALAELTRRDVPQVVMTAYGDRKSVV